MKKGESPQNDLMWLSNFESDELDLNLLQKTQKSIVHLSST